MERKINENMCAMHHMASNRLNWPIGAVNTASGRCYVKQKMSFLYTGRDIFPEVADMNLAD